MKRWVGKVAVVTGASSGIGAATTIDLVKAGMIVVAIARRVKRVEVLKNKISRTATGVLYPRKCDLNKEEDIVALFNWIDVELGGVHVLINNAGVNNQAQLLDDNNTAQIRQVIDTNIVAVVQCTREAFKSMKRRNFDGHIVIINSIGGHNVPYAVGCVESFSIYRPTKFAITAITETLRQEFQANNTKIKITVSFKQIKSFY